MSVRQMLAACVAVASLAACAGQPAATRFAPTILAFQGSTCEQLAAEFAAVGDPSLRSVIDGPDQIADEDKSVLISTMQGLLVLAVTQRAREAGVIADCDMPDWLQRAETGFTDQLRTRIGAVAYDGNPVITYQAWLAELNDRLVQAGMGKGERVPVPTAPGGLT